MAPRTVGYNSLTSLNKGEGDNKSKKFSNFDCLLLLKRNIDSRKRSKSVPRPNTNTKGVDKDIRSIKVEANIKMTAPSSSIDLADPFKNLDPVQDAAEIKRINDLLTNAYISGVVNKAVVGAVRPTSSLDLASEMPSSLIPQYGGKVSLWAERVESILRSRGYVDFKSPELTRDFLPIIINRIPQDAARDIPTTNLEDALNYLKSIDRVKYDLNQCFVEGRKLEKAPSMAYNALINRARKALPGLDVNGKLDPNIRCPDEHLKTVAWTSLKAGLPPQIAGLAMALNIRYFPNSDQLEALDDAWAEYNSTKDIPSVFSIKSDTSTSTKITPDKYDTLLENQSRQIQQISNTLNEMRSCNAVMPQRGRVSNYTSPTGSNPRFAPGANSASWNSRTPPARPFIPRGQASGVRPTFTAPRANQMQNRQGAGYSPRQARFPTPAFPNRMDLCFWHRTFGKNAVRHEQPCAWVYPQGEQNK